MIVCPGGGYDSLAWEKEGTNPAKWLAGVGILGIALKYRLAPRYRHPAQLLDLQRAVRVVRSCASSWKIDGSKIGVLGFSAGGHLASLASVEFDGGDLGSGDGVERVSCRPDLAVLLYAVINLRDHPHTRSPKNLLGEHPSLEGLEKLSTNFHVTRGTPAAFLFHTVEDGAVPVENSLQYAMALRKAGVAFELHCFEKGRHGVGLAADDPVLKSWPGLCEKWLKNQNFCHG
jgi:acetyl esterase/lipase